MDINDWFNKWNISAEARTDYCHRMGMTPPTTTVGCKSHSEAWVQNEIRKEASENNVWLWRNNVGALINPQGVPVRFGLMNDSKQLNEKFKSSDLIGARKLLITQDMVGTCVAQLTARECKEEGWIYTGSSREVAQLRFLNLVLAIGGDASFVTGRGTL